MKQKKVFFRADASSQIGLGHLIRCTALAEMLGNEFDITFVVKEIPEKSTYLLKELNFGLQLIKEEETFLSQLNGDEIVVLDHYGLDSDYQRSVKQKGCKLVCIDDLHDKHFYADTIINHAPGVTAGQYDAEPYTKFYLGLDYALLRKQFRDGANKDRKLTAVNNVLICFGGADPHNLTLKILDVVVNSKLFDKINVIAGTAFSHFTELEKFCEMYQNVSYYTNLSAAEMLEMMHRCELAIVPASSIAIECLSAKMILLTGVTDDNQKDIHDGLTQYNTVKTIQDFNTVNNKTLINQLKSIKSGTEEFVFSDIGNAGDAIKEIFKTLVYDTN